MDGKTSFILASASPRRLELLKALGLAPAALFAPEIDETPRAGERPDLYALRLAREKAEVARAAHPQQLILAADTVVACGRRILPKAEDEGQVRSCLALLSGRRHRVYTAIAVVTRKGDVRTRLCESYVRFKRLQPHEIEAYAASGEGVGKAGGYGLQGRAARLIVSIGGSYSGIVGLPLYETGQLLEQEAGL